MTDNPQPDHRALKAIVAGLGVLLAISFLVVIGTVIYRISTNSESSETPARVVAGPGDVRVPIGAGMEVSEATAEDGTLVVRLKSLTGGPSQVMIFDVATGELLRVFTFAPEKP